MSSSRLFQLAKSVGVVGSIGGAAYLSATDHQKRRDEFQKTHPGAVVREQFQYVPGVGGYWKFSAEQNTSEQKQEEPIRPTNK